MQGRYIDQFRDWMHSHQPSDPSYYMCLGCFEWRPPSDFEQDPRPYFWCTSHEVDAPMLTCVHCIRQDRIWGIHPDTGVHYSCGNSVFDPLPPILHEQEICYVHSWVVGTLIKDKKSWVKV